MGSVPFVVRLVRAAVAAGVAMMAVAILWAIADLYVSGHSIAVPVILGRPLHRLVANVLLVVAPVAAAVLSFLRHRLPDP